MTTKTSPPPKNERRIIISKKRQTQQVAVTVPNALALPQAQIALDHWIQDLNAGGASFRYRETVNDVVTKFLWFCRRDGYSTFDPASVRSFLLYLQNAHTYPEGRWGEPGETKETRRGRQGVAISKAFGPMSPASVRDYWRHLRTFSNWCYAQKMVAQPMTEGTRQPIHREGVSFHVFTRDEWKLIEAAAKKSNISRRDYPLVLFLLDTGVRASELCGLKWSDVDVVKRRASILGKGGKQRYVYWTPKTQRALWGYANTTGMDPGFAVFQGEYGRNTGGPLTVEGLGKICAKLGKAAGVPHSNPHTFRHTFAVFFLLAKGNIMQLMDLMGHDHVDTTRRYLRFTENDLANVAREHSPVTYMDKKR